MREANSYNPWDYYYRDARLKRVMDALNSDRFCPGEPGLFNWLFYAILNYGDHYYHLADLPSYIEAQERAGIEYLNQEEWSRKAILNVARTGKFSSDRTVLEYAREIWNIKRYMRKDEKNMRSLLLRTLSICGLVVSAGVLSSSERRRPPLLGDGICVGDQALRRAYTPNRPPHAPRIVGALR